MALSRRSNRSMHAAIWPGFVDAMTALLMVITFVLAIFMMMQFVLREEISGQETELDALTAQFSGLSRALGLAETRAETLEAERDGLAETAASQSELIAGLEAQSTSQSERILGLEAEAAAQSGRIARFEEQVASLLSQRDAARTRVVDLEAAETRLISDAEALNLALAQAREEIDAGAEAARLAAARREALEALTAQLRADLAGAERARANLGAEAEALQTALSEEESRRVTEAAAAEALRARLVASDAELSALSLALEAERAEAEETLTLLAAAEAAQEDLDAQLGAALLARDAASTTADDLDRRLAAALEDNAALSQTAEDLRRARTEALSQADRTDAMLQAALSRASDQAREMAAISDALAAAKAAGQAFQGDLEEARARLVEAEAHVADLRAAAGREADERDELAAALLAAQARAAALDAATNAQADLRDQLREALALKLAAEARAETQMSEAERQATLLATARDLLAREEETSAEAQREMAVLSRQVTDLRQQIGILQGLLDSAEAADAEADVQIEDLSKRLNAALVREAAEQRRRAALEAAERQRLERYQSEFFGRLRDLLGDRDGVQIVGDRFVFDSEVLFPSGSASLSRAGREQVARVAALLEEVADDIPDTIDWVIRVDGHTDNVPVSANGSFRDNWDLSQARALSVVRFMSDGLGFPARRLAPTGFGEFRPVDTANTPEARARNRRIELKLTER